jgi:hypothetical protein
MDNQLEELDFGGEYGKVRWTNPELARKWKSWLESNRSSFTNPNMAPIIARTSYEEDLWNDFFQRTLPEDLDIEKEALRGEEEGTTIDQKLLKDKFQGITTAKDITDDVRRKYMQREIRFKNSSDSSFPNDKIAGMMDNLYNPATVNSDRVFNASLANAKSVNEQYNSTVSNSAVKPTASPSRASLLYNDSSLPVWMRVAKGTEPWGPKHPQMKEWQQGFLEGKYKPDQFGNYPSLEVMNDINQAENPQAARASQATWLRLREAGRLNDNGDLGSLSDM